VTDTTTSHPTHDEPAPRRGGEFWLGVGVVACVVAFLFACTFLIVNYQNTERDKQVSKTEACRTIEQVDERSVCLRGVS